ncbi:hypothetical protein [Hyalangium minutum]|uniref:hypothetical protein n=1 Tax=Hyalangium minutum TaxID=394096 RepID=UPI0005C74E86|nr:hypothetical protein [Hyalangium minutum]
MADDTMKGPPKLTLLRGGGSETTHSHGPWEAPPELARLPQEQKEIEAFELFGNAFELLLKVEQTLTQASRLTEVERAQAEGGAPTKLYAASFFEALAALHVARARISECREAVRHHVVDGAPPPKGGRRSKRRTQTD